MKKIFISLLSITAFSTLSAQDTHFSQFNEMRTILNPAFTASDCDMRANVVYRNQWKVIPVTYKTMGASFETNLVRLTGGDKEENKGLKNISTGLSVISDKAGEGKMGFTQANLSFGVMVPMTKTSKLAVAFSGGIGQKSVNYSELTWDAQYDGTAYDPGLATGENFDNENFAYQDLSAGINYIHGVGPMYNRTAGAKAKFNVGYSIQHINRPKMSHYNDFSQRVDMKHVGTFGLLLPLGPSGFDLAPSFYTTSQGKVSETVVGTLIKANMKSSNKLADKMGGTCISIGGFYRLNDSMIGQILLEFGNWGIGYNYDMGNSDINKEGKTANAHEFSLRFTSPNPHQAKPAEGN